MTAVTADTITTAEIRALCKAHRAAVAERAACEARQVNGHGHCTHTVEDHERLGWTCDYWPVGRCTRCNAPAMAAETETTP